MSFEGLTAATVFCADRNPATVAKRLKTLGLADDLTDDWSSADISGKHGEMTVTREMFEPDSAFSRAILVAHNAARLAEKERPDAQGPDARTRVLGALESCDMLLRFGFTPALADSDERLTAALSLAEATNGILFGGRTFADESGEVILVARPLAG